MFDRLLKSKFYSKCKAGIKLTRTRIEMIKKKRNAMQKYLRNDVADLLKNGLDFNAYGRAEGLLAELNRSNCFEFIDQCCVQISNNLATMDKQRECPEECREAASSLMFAAARFAELPELRDLRTIFSERYTNSLDFYVNKQFMENLKSGHPSKDMKLQLLQDIAVESGLEWNSKGLENKLYNEPSCKKDFREDFNDKEYASRKSVDYSVRRKEFRDDKEYEHKSLRDWDAAPERKDGLLYYGKQDKSEDRLPRKTENIALPEDEICPPLLKTPNEVPPVKDIQVDTIGRNEKWNEPESSVPKEEKHEEKPLKYRSIPPPYVKSDVNKTDSSLRDPMKDSCEEKVETTKLADCVDTEKNRDQDDLIDKANPMPKSVRRRRLNPPPVHDNSGHSDRIERDKLKEINKEQAAQGQRILKFLDNGGDDDQLDKEEKMMDKLLLHYSKKKPTRETGKSDSDIKPPTEYAPADSSTATKYRNRDGPSRLSSLPGVVTSPSETPKRHARAYSLQPEMLNTNGHVHPKLPDYDDFVARLAALRRK